jgi:hypothetical protein
MWNVWGAVIAHVTRRLRCLEIGRLVRSLREREFPENLDVVHSHIVIKIAHSCACLVCR